MISCSYSLIPTVEARNKSAAENANETSRQMFFELRISNFLSSLVIRFSNLAHRLTRAIQFPAHSPIRDPPSASSNATPKLFIVSGGFHGELSSLQNRFRQSPMCSP